MRSPLNLLALALAALFGVSLVFGSQGEAAGPDDEPTLVEGVLDVTDPDGGRKTLPVARQPGEGGDEPADAEPAPAPRFAAEAPPFATGDVLDVSRGRDVGASRDDKPRLGPAIAESIDPPSGFLARPADVTPSYAGRDADDPLEAAAAAEAGAGDGSFMGARTLLIAAAIGAEVDEGAAQPASDGLVAFSSGFLGRGSWRGPEGAEGEVDAPAGEASHGLLGGFLGGAR